MKIGSLVELVDDTNWKYFHEYNNIYPVKGVTYTVRSVEAFPNGAGILLEEIVNPPRLYILGMAELHFTAKRFRELLPPIDIVAKIEETKEVELCN
jgi:hypothetical protein